MRACVGIGVQTTTGVEYEFFCEYETAPPAPSPTPDHLYNHAHNNYYSPPYSIPTGYNNQPSLAYNYEHVKQKSMDSAQKLTRAGFVMPDGRAMTDQEIAREMKWREERLNSFPGKDKVEKMNNALNKLADDVRSASKQQSSKHIPKQPQPESPQPEPVKSHSPAEVKYNIEVAFVRGTKPIFDKLVNKQPLTPKEVELSHDKARLYYKYINLHGGAKYGKIALDVLDKRTSFGQVASIHLETAAKKHGFDQAKVERIMQEYPIYLASRDAQMRVKEGFDPKKEAAAISEYHYDGLEKLYGLPPEAWGGALFEEFGGSGSWMHLDDLSEIQGKKVMSNIIRAVAEDASHNGVSARLALSYLWQTQIAAYDAMPELQDIPMRYGLPIADLIEAKGMSNFLIDNPAAQSFWSFFFAMVQQELGVNSFKEVTQAAKGNIEWTDSNADHLQFYSTDESVDELYTPPGHYADEG